MAEYYDPAGSEIPAYAGQRPRYPGVGRFLRTDRGNAAHRRSGTSTGRSRHSIDGGAVTTKTPRPGTEIVVYTELRTRCSRRCQLLRTVLSNDVDKLTEAVPGESRKTAATGTAPRVRIPMGDSS